MFIQNFKKENKIQKPNLKIDIFPLPFESRVFWQAKASRMTWDPAELRPKWHESIAEREFKACLQFENPPPHTGSDQPKTRLEYWATRSSIRLLRHARSAALTCSLTRSLCSLPSS